MKKVRKAHNFVDITGMSYGLLTVEAYAGPAKSGKATWYCQCKCGKRPLVDGVKLRNGQVKSCGCLHKKKPGEGALLHLFRSYKKGAEKRNLSWGLNLTDFELLIIATCTTCGNPPSLKAVPGIRATDYNGNMLYNGIDRIDNDLGYISSNCRTMCKYCNHSKGVLPEDEFQDWIKRLVKWNTTIVRSIRETPGCYLAGPDVFSPDVHKIGNRLKTLCKTHGLEGLFPMDNQLPANLSPADGGEWIYQADRAMMDRAAVCVANISPFRGVSADVGTSYEMGYMYAQGKPIFAYSDEHDMSYSSKVIRYYSSLHEAEKGIMRDKDGNMVEDFGMTDNLMIVVPSLLYGGKIFPTAAEAIEAAARYLLDKARVAG